MVSIKAVVYGRVQGVFYRAFVTKQARELGVTGYVRNLADGSVEVRAEGEKQKLMKLVGYLGVGPPSARVDKVATHWLGYTGRYSGFRAE